MNHDGAANSDSSDYAGKSDNVTRNGLHRTAGCQAQRTAAARMRRYRERKSAGVVRVDFEVLADGAALLVELGWLVAAARQDPVAVREAFERFVNGAAAAGIVPAGIGKHGGDA